MEILEKIKKLLRLGGDKAATQAEAELAVQRAFELASRHQIDIETVSLEDDARKIVLENMAHPGRVSFARKKLLNLLPTFFNVNVVLACVPKWLRTAKNQPHVTFIGTTVDIQIARYVYDYLHTACAAALREFIQGHKRRPAASTQKQFVQGFVYGVARTLRAAKGELSEHQNAMIVSESGRRDQFQETAFNPDSLKPVKMDAGRRNYGAMISGVAAGERVEIRKPIASHAAGQLLLGA